MKSLRIKYAIAFLVGAVLGLLYFASSVTAYADASQMSVAANGLVNVRGALVTKVSANEIIATSRWGSTLIQWRIRTSGSTRFLPQMASREMFRTIKAGHTIGFSGDMDTSESSPTVFADVVKDESLMQSAVIIGGTVMSTSDHRFTVGTESGTSTIVVGSGTIMTLQGEPVEVGDLHSGDLIRAFGTLNPVRRELEASRVMVVPADMPVVTTPAKRGILDSIMAWIRGTDGAISVR